MDILIAEDEFLISLTLKAQLEAMGHKVVGTSKDGASAVALAKELRPELVFMDIGMPGMDGIAATTMIMAEVPVPIVMLTAYNDRRRVQDAMRAGAAAYVLKPANEAQLKRAIRDSVTRFKQANAEAPE